MKIFYGVQGTGNGHISRARSIATEFKNTEHEVDFMFSGRDSSKYFDMEIFGNYQTRKGLTFSIDNGKVNVLQTIINNDFTTFLKDIDNLDLSNYDLIITDYEPITAWAARIQMRPSIGIGHQYAFNYGIPVSHSNFVTRAIMKWFAPADYGVGCHWSSFGYPIIPPIIDVHEPSDIIKDKILVYLQFEDKKTIHDLLIKLPQAKFVVYGFDIDEGYPNIVYKKASRDGFIEDLKNCNGVICNSGFELISEALVMGKKILTKPVIGQMEQHSNALALNVLGYATVVNSFNLLDINLWLLSTYSRTIKYPNVAKIVVDNITDLQSMDIDTIWKQINDNSF